MPPGQVAQIQIIAGTSNLPAGLRQAQQMIGSFASNISRQLANGFRMQPLRQVGAEAMRGAARAIGQRGLDFVVDQAKDVYDFEKALTRFGITARKTPADMRVIATQARALSNATGLGAIEVLGAARAYIDLAGAENYSAEKMSVLARAAQATGSDTQDLAGMMFQLTESMKVTDDQMEQTMGGLINQAKDGAIEAKQMAKEFAGMMPMFQNFGKVGRAGAVELGAMYQVTRKGFDSAAQAATGMERLMAGLQRHAGRFRAAGIDVFKPGSKRDLRELPAILKDIRAKGLDKDIEKLIKAFGRSEAWRTYDLLRKNVDEVERLKAAGMENGVIQKDLATYTESTAGRMEIAMEKMKNAIAAAFTPERIQAFVSALEGLAGKIAPIANAIGWIGDRLGDMYKAGQAVRGLVSGDMENNPWKELQGEQRAFVYRGTRDSARHALTSDMRKGSDGKFIYEDRSAEYDRLLRQETNRGAYSRTVKELMAAQGGDDNQPTDDAIRRAITARARDKSDLGGLGEHIAGDRYLSNLPAGRADELKKSDSEAIREAMERLPGLLSKVFPSARQQAVELQKALLEGQSMVVEADGNSLMKVTHNASAQRRKNR